MKLMTKAIREKLLANNLLDNNGEIKPVVKFFDPTGAATWLITEMEGDGDTMFGLADLGFGMPELGYVSLNELMAVKGAFGLGIERDLYFTAGKTIGEYADDAAAAGRIVT